MTYPSDTSSFITDFRQAAPYIQYLRNKVLVIAISSYVLKTEGLHSLAQDIQLLSSLGVRLVLVHGTRQYLNTMIHTQAETQNDRHGWRITDDESLEWVKRICGQIRFDLEAALSATPAQTPDRSRNRLRIASGNFLLAKPLGVIDGCDMQHTGQVRKIDTDTINQRLHAGEVILVSPIGQSRTGKTFNLSLDEVARSLAIDLKAEKLIFLGQNPYISDTTGNRISQLTVPEANELIKQSSYQHEITRMLQAAVDAVQHGVTRSHIISGICSGSLITELFTREGCGTVIAQTPFVCIRQADSRDTGDILNLIEPLQQKGILLERNQEYLENHIQEFYVLEHDCHIYGCVALKHFPEQPNTGELACLVVSPEAQKNGYGALLLNHIIDVAKQSNIQYLLALSTHTGGWFDERNFVLISPNQLPEIRRQQYFANGRQSKIYQLDLSSKS